MPPVTREQTRSAVGNTIRAFRHRAGKTLDELAAHCGRSRPTVSSWEKGQACPDASDLVALATLFGIQPSDLLPRESAAA